MRKNSVKYNTPFITSLLLGMGILVTIEWAAAQPSWINEIHYNNVGDDLNEMVEVVLAQNYAGDLAAFTVELYNGSDGQMYASHALSTFTKGATLNGFVFYFKNITGIQNAHPSGLALSLNGITTQFLSYGGTFQAVNGPAAGYTSENIGVTENNATAIGLSLQLAGTADQYAHFQWDAPSNDTPGELNLNQNFLAPRLELTLTDATSREPSKPLDTISYQLELRNAGAGNANDLTINRKGDPNTSLLPGTFQSTVLALPGNITTALEDQQTTLLLRALDPDGDALVFSVVSPPQNGILTGLTAVSKTTASITYQPNSGFNGSDQFAFAVMDNDNNRDTAIVKLTTQAVNDAPGFVLGKDVVLVEDAGQQLIKNWATGITKGAANETNQSIEFRIWSISNPDLFSSLPEVAADGTLAFHTQKNANGIAEIVIQLKDNGGTANGGVDTSARHRLVITVNPVNDAPSFTGGQNVSILEDADNQSFENWATNLAKGPADESDQTLEFLIFNNSNPDLFTQVPALTNDGKLTFTVKENKSGIAEMVLQLKDNGGTANGGVDTSAFDTIVITVNPVNDAPSFTKGEPVVLKTTDTTQIFNNWVKDILAGPMDEAGQIVTFVIENNDNTTLFAEAPQVSSTGTLSFKPAAGAVGIATIKISLKDNGGTANGGVDMSDAQIFTITIEPAE